MIVSANILITLLVAIFTCSAVSTALAGKGGFRVYNADQGLSSLGGHCLVQAPGGFILVCTESGLFAYDGRRFDNLGPDQGLRQGGYVYDIALAASGRIAIRFADEVLVSDRKTDASDAPRSLSFASVAHPGLRFFDAGEHRLVAWRDGFALLVGETLERIVIEGPGAPHVEAIEFTPSERAVLSGAEEVFAVGGHLWLASDDGRLCTADPGSVRCFGEADGLRGDSWSDVVSGDAGQLFARSPSSVATFDPARSRWSTVDLPDQGGRYRAYAKRLTLLKTPDGGLATQADHGLAVLGPNGWRALSTENGAPSGTIVSAMTDNTGQLWFQVFGQGLERWIGYGRWETFQKSNGLSDSIAWQTARTPDGPLWISTDTGLDEVVRSGGSLKLAKVIPESAFALAIGPHGRLWSGITGGDVLAIDPATGTATKFDMPTTNAIATGSGDDVWFGTRHGLFREVDSPGGVSQPQIMGTIRMNVADVASDGVDGVYYLSSGRLRRFRPDGSDTIIVEDWPVRGFEPVSLARDHNGAVWVGGAGGLFRFTLSGDKVITTLAVPDSDTLSNSVVAVMVDHQGWVWVGTTHGVSIFNGARWVTLDEESGLAADDVNQGGIREDPDGSVWITTVEGVSHLLDTSWLFTDDPIEVLISGATLGSRPVTGPMPYSEAALSVEFGTPSYRAERSIRFFYHLSDVDAGQAESKTGLVRYAFVPPGHHILTVRAFDDLTHQSSEPATLTIDIALPWWRQWWAILLWGACALTLAYGALRLRLHAVMVRQAELERHVALATEKLRYDGLTGLLNRREIERHLADKLADPKHVRQTVVALLDVDHFKQVNDRHGHLGGDEVLRTLARLTLADVWDGEHAGRFGGEEFLLVLCDEDGRGTERVLHLLHTIRGTPINAGGTSVRVTCSIGLAWAMPGDDWESLVGRADEALYEAKAAGRDRVVESRNRSPSRSRPRVAIATS